jgi:hypothetical protein
MFDPAEPDLDIDETALPAEEELDFEDKLHTHGRPGR